MIEIKLKVVVSEHWARGLNLKNKGLRFLSCAPYGKQGCQDLLEFKGDKKEVEDILKSIRRHDNVLGVETTSFKDFTVLAAVISRKCPANRVISGSKCFLMSSTCNSKGDLFWRVYARSSKDAMNMILKLEKSGCAVKVQSISTISVTKMLTMRQSDIVEYAHGKGYYEFPKRITMKEIAKRYRISTATVGEILQRGEKKIMDLFFTKD